MREASGRAASGSQGDDADQERAGDAEQHLVATATAVETVQDRRDAADREHGARHGADLATAAPRQASASRSASTGSTLVARRAGTSAATTVTTVPTSSDTQIVRGTTCIDVLGRLKPIASMSTLQALGDRRPECEPIADAASPSSAASTSRLRLDLAPGRADRTQQRDLA